MTFWLLRARTPRKAITANPARKSPISTNPRANILLTSRVKASSISASRSSKVATRSCAQGVEDDASFLGDRRKDRDAFFLNGCENRFALRLHVVAHQGLLAAG